MMVRKRRNRKPLFIALLTLVGACLLVFGLEKTNAINLVGINGLIINTTKDGADNVVNLDPATEQEQRETEQHKDNLANTPSSPSPTGSDGLKQVIPQISYVDTSVINAYITGIFEEGGVCTATLTNGESTSTRSSTGFGNASYTQCAPIDLSGTGIAKGWSATVTYESSTAKGTSEVVTIP